MRGAGGLGNQLFQLSFLLSFAFYKKNAKLIFNANYLSNYNAIRKFSVNELFDLNQLGINIKNAPLFIFTLRLAKLFGAKNKIFAFINDKNCNIQEFSSRHVFCDGYFIWAINKEKFFNIAKKVYASLRPELDQSSHDICAVHVRGNDFRQLGWNNQCPVSYYKNAIRYFKQKYKVDKFSVVTDDIEYARSIFCSESAKINFISSNLTNDFELLLNSRYKIISGSSFSIWAAVLGGMKNTEVTISPNRNYYIPNMVYLQ